MERFPIFESYEFGEEQKAEMDRVGHFVLPGILTPEACERLTESLSYIQSLVPNATQGHEPNRFSAEYDEFLESLIGHPQMLTLVRQVLGGDIRYDHCVSLNRPVAIKGFVGIATSTRMTIPVWALCVSSFTSTALMLMTVG